MTIILFIVDTSASMNQRTCYNMTFVDIATKAINDFVQQRKRDPNSRGDRYMLMTFEETPFCLKAGWKENQEVFDSSLKIISANQLNDVAATLKNAFTLLNLNKLQSNKETYGSGRYPSLLDPTIMILISDGVNFQKAGKSSSAPQPNNVLQTNSFAVSSTTSTQASSTLFSGSAAAASSHQQTSAAATSTLTAVPVSLNTIRLDIPGSVLCNAPYRWDQRMFAWILKFPGRQLQAHAAAAANTAAVLSPSSSITAVNQLPPRDLTSLLDLYAVETGGRSFAIDNFAAMQAVITATCQQVVPGVVVAFEMADKLVLQQIMRASAEAGVIAATRPPGAGATQKSPGTMVAEKENNDLALLMPPTSASPKSTIADENADSTALLDLIDGGNIKQMLIVKRESANTRAPLIQAMWPIPENYAPEDGFQQNLPPRTVHPHFQLHFEPNKTIRLPQAPSNSSTNKQLISDDKNNKAAGGGAVFAVDRFDLESTPFSEYLLKISAVYRDCSWPISVAVRTFSSNNNSAANNNNNNMRPNTRLPSSIPCGYLKASAPNVLSLYLLPAHYDKLFHLLNNYSAEQIQNPSQIFRDEFLNYIGQIPFYVREALVKYGFRGFYEFPPSHAAPGGGNHLVHLLTDCLCALAPSGLSHNLTTRLRNDKLEAKRQHEDLIARGVVARPYDATVPIVMPHTMLTTASSNEAVWQIWKDIIEVRGGAGAGSFDQLDRMRTAAVDELMKRQALRIAARQPQQMPTAASTDNPFDVERDQLLLALRKSRKALLDGPGGRVASSWFAESTDDVDDARHAMLSHAMGNFVEFKKTLPLMPELRTHTLLNMDEYMMFGGEHKQSFGNPFKSKHSQRESSANAAGAMIDEMMDIDFMPTGGSGNDASGSASAAGTSAAGGTAGGAGGDAGGTGSQTGSRGKSSEHHHNHQHHHSSKGKSGKSSVVSRSRSKIAPVRGGGGANSAAAALAGGVAVAAIGAFANRTRGPLARNFSWQPFAVRSAIAAAAAAASALRNNSTHKRSASVSGGLYDANDDENNNNSDSRSINSMGDHADTTQMMMPLSPAMSLPDLSKLSKQQAADDDDDNQALTPTTTNNFWSAPSSPAVSESSNANSDSAFSSSDSNQLSDADGEGLSSDIGGGGDAANNDHASYAALVQHQDELRRELQTTTSEDDADIANDVSSDSSSSASLLGATSESIYYNSTGEQLLERTQNLLENIVLSGKRGEYEFRRSSWFYGIVMLDAKQRLRNVIRGIAGSGGAPHLEGEAKSNHVELLCKIFDQAGTAAAAAAADADFDSAEPANNSNCMAMLMQLHLIIDAFNEALRFKLLSIAHHIYDYFVMKIEKRLCSKKLNIPSDNNNNTAAASATCLQHYVPASNPDFLSRFRSSTMHLLPARINTLSLSAMDEDDDNNNAHTATASSSRNDLNSRSKTGQLQNIHAVAECAKLFENAAAAVSASNATNLDDNTVSQLKLCCATLTRRKTPTVGGANEAADPQENISAALTQQLKIFKSAAATILTSKKSENASASTNTEAKQQLQSLYERVYELSNSSRQNSLLNYADDDDNHSQAKTTTSTTTLSSSEPVPQKSSLPDSVLKAFELGESLRSRALPPEQHQSSSGISNVATTTKRLKIDSLLRLPPLTNGNESSNSVHRRKHSADASVAATSAAPDTALILDIPAPGVSSFLSAPIVPSTTSTAGSVFNFEQKKPPPPTSTTSPSPTEDSEEQRRRALKARYMNDMRGVESLVAPSSATTLSTSSSTSQQQRARASSISTTTSSAKHHATNGPSSRLADATTTNVPAVVIVNGNVSNAAAASLSALKDNRR